MTTTPVDPRPAASLIPLRDGADGLELFMIERHHALRFAPGATVFPGGRLEAANHAAHWRGLWPGGEPPEDLPRRVAAVREAFEECGLLPTDGPQEMCIRDRFLPKGLLGLWAQLTAKLPKSKSLPNGKPADQKGV